MLNTIPLSALLEELPRLPALVVGPGATSHTGIADDIGRIVATQFDVSVNSDVDSTYFEVLDTMSGNSVQRIADAKEVVRENLCNPVRSPAISSLVTVRWSAVVSLSPDSNLEDVLRLKYDNSASSWSITIVDNAEVSPAQRTVPIYKLLGNPRDLRAEYGPVLDSSSLLLRKQFWPQILFTFPDYVRQAPVLVLGTESNRDLLREFLASLFSRPGPHPRSFYFS